MYKYQSLLTSSIIYHDRLKIKGKMKPLFTAVHLFNLDYYFKKTGA